MAQLALPYRIALAGLAVLALAWFTVLRPKDSSTAPATPTPATAPGMTGLNNAVGKARGAAAAANASAAASQSAVDQAAASATGGHLPATKTVMPNPTATPQSTARAAAAAEKRLAAARQAKLRTLAAAKRRAAAAKDPSSSLLAGLGKGRAAVVLFYNPKGADDRAVRDALKSVDRHKGKVAVRAVPIDAVATYKAITADVAVTQAPTLLVIGSDKKAHQMTGLTDTRGIDQLVGNVLKASPKG